MKGNLARVQLDADRVKVQVEVDPDEHGIEDGETNTGRTGVVSTEARKTTAIPPKRFHGTVALDSARVGRDAGRVAEEVIAHLTGLVGATVTVTLEIEAQIPSGASDHIVRTVTENSRTLKFTSQGFERE